MSFCVFECHTVSLWLLCNLHYVQSIRPNIAHDLADLKARIIAAVKNIDSCVARTWVLFRCAVSPCGAHKEQVSLTKKEQFFFDSRQIY
jgi:hypothetical protein